MLFFLYLLFGKIRLTVRTPQPEKTISALLKRGVDARGIKKTDEQTLELVIPRADRAHARAAVCETGGELAEVRHSGLPAFFSRYKNRWGLLAGAALFCGVIALSTQFLWRIEISGNRRMSREEILDTLRENGVHEGAAVSSIDIDDVQHRCVLGDDRIAWVSLNRVGTVMQVELREALSYAELESTPANVVAAYDAQIESVEVHDGVAVVGVGDSVRAGELLISGVVDGSMDGLRNLRADGKILGRVMERLRVEAPFDNERKVYTGREIRKSTLNFFGNSINLFINSRISMQKYDTMVNRKNMLLYDGTALPVGISTAVHREYELRTVTDTPAQAVERAQAELRRQVDAVLKDGELLARSQSFYLTEDSYVIECELYVLRDIAEQIPIG